MALAQTISTLYAATGLIIIGSYGPQLWSVWRSRNGARDVSLLTWAGWSASAVVSVLYSSLVVRDRTFTLVCCGHLVGCLAILGTTLARRRAGGAAGDAGA